jgi:predicted transcriptional regulator
MTDRKPLARISCTIPENILAAADEVATREQRSRSWVISEALRRYAVSDMRGPAVARRAVWAPYQAGAEPVSLDPG